MNFFGSGGSFKGPLDGCLRGIFALWAGVTCGEYDKNKYSRLLGLKLQR